MFKNLRQIESNPSRRVQFLHNFLERPLTSSYWLSINKNIDLGFEQYAYPPYACEDT